MLEKHMNVKNLLLFLTMSDCMHYIQKEVYI